MAAIPPLRPFNPVTPVFTSEEQRANQVALIQIWPCIQQANPNIPDLDTAEEMSAWLTDPKNQAEIDHVKSLNLEDLEELTDLPFEIGVFRKLKRLNCCGCPLTALPES